MKSGKLEWSELVNQFKKGDFSIYHDPLSRKCMETMYQVIEEEQGAKTWFMIDGSIFSKDLIWDRISHHPKVSTCDHTGASMSWTVAQFIKIYQEGWANWVIPILLEYGIGWDEFTFSQVLAYGNERPAIFKLQQGELIRSPYEVLEIVTHKNMDKLMEIVLEKVGDQIKLEEYEMLVKWCQKNKRYDCERLLLAKWDQIYHRKIDITGLDLEDLVKKIWYYNRTKLDKKEPTSQNIKNFILRQKLYLKGVFININWTNSTIDPINYPNLALF